MHIVRQLKKGLSWLLVLSASCSASAVTTAGPSKKDTAVVEQNTVSSNSTAPADTVKSTSLPVPVTPEDAAAHPASATDTTTAATTTTAAATADSTTVVNNDPYERFNRAMFQFNEVVDRLIMKPIATLYIKIVPKPLSKGLSNFYNNIDTIPTVANDLLQANFYQGTSDAWRLAINSSVGILGFFDFATDMGLEPNKEDFGLTLAQWGYRDSNYLVLPLLGPGTVRDQIGWPINYYFLTIYPHIYPVIQRNELYLTSLVVKRAELLRYQNVLEEASLDDYTFIRDAYMQRRAYQLERNAELNDPYLEKNNPSEAEKVS